MPAKSFFFSKIIHCNLNLLVIKMAAFHPSIAWASFILWKPNPFIQSFYSFTLLNINLFQIHPSNCQSNIYPTIPVCTFSKISLIIWKSKPFILYLYSSALLMINLFQIHSSNCQSNIYPTIPVCTFSRTSLIVWEPKPSSQALSTINSHGVLLE